MTKTSYPNTTPSCRDQIVILAEAYAKAVGHTSLKRVSTLIFKEGKKIDLIIAGADLNTRSYEHGVRWFLEQWPKDTPWPPGVPKPIIPAQKPKKKAKAA